MSDILESTSHSPFEDSIQVPGPLSSRFSAPRSCSGALRVRLIMKKRTAPSWR